MKSISDDPGKATRRAVLAGAAGLTVLTAGARTQAQAGNDEADVLFVQTAQGMAFDADLNQLTLRGVTPVTLFFSDRPERLAGNMTTEAFVPFWSQGADSFLSDPPNADLSIIEDGKLRQTVVVLRGPVLLGDDLRYTVQIIDGEMPMLGDAVSVFIDIIGMPRTPLSYAGVARRSYRRAVLY